MELKLVEMKKPEDVNIIIGQSHFIKTAEDLYEALINSVPNIKFGLAFSEASGACKIRSEGNDSALKDLAVENSSNLKAGHSFIILLKNAYPINVLNAVKSVPEVCNIFCATANPVKVIIAVVEKGSAILGVVDGLSPEGAEKEEDISWRRNFLRKIGYKL
ncbi:MAG: adenosine monophosphate-protein transferase [Candidatus Omnitrophica bacterium]|nr:adenosine monophosphate-protein transferase [Candidatus Omnitrophota bacterium]